MVFPDSTFHFEAPSKGSMPQRIGPFRGSGHSRAIGSCGRIVSILLTLSALSGPAEAQVRGLGFREVDLRLDPRPPIGVLQIEPSVHLEGVMPGELLSAGGARAIPAASWRSGLLATSAFELDLRVVRSIPAVWSMRVEDLDALAGLDVRCEITGQDGAAGALTHPADPSSVIHVWIRPLSPQVVGGATGDILVEGGVVLDMDLRDVHSAGPHSGTLTVTVERF